MSSGSRIRSFSPHRPLLPLCRPSSVALLFALPTLLALPLRRPFTLSPCALYAALRSSVLGSLVPTMRRLSPLHPRVSAPPPQWGIFPGIFVVFTTF